MTLAAERIMDGVELHRQRDELEASLRALVAALMEADSTDPLAATKILMRVCASKLLLAELGGRS